MSVNTIIGYFANSSIKFMDIFSAQLDPFSVDTGRKTAKGVCGLVIPIKGHAHFSLNGTRYEMNRKTILHAGSRMDIKIETMESEWEYVVIHYQVMHLTEEWKDIHNQHFMLTVDEGIPLIEQIDYLLKNQTQPDYMAKIQVQNVFMRLLESILLSARNGRFESKQDAILAALEFIQIHYAEEISICELAEQFGMKRRRFSYLFEQLTGFTPIDYLTEYRMSRAKELLRTSDFSIAKIAEKVGYSDSFYFSRVFKKRSNLSPSAYREKHEENSHFSL